LIDELLHLDNESVHLAFAEKCCTCEISAAFEISVVYVYESVTLG